MTYVRAHNYLNYELSVEKRVFLVPLCSIRNYTKTVRFTPDLGFQLRPPGTEGGESNRVRSLNG